MDQRAALGQRRDRVTTGSSGSMSTLTSSAASSARYRDSATTMAIRSPTYRTSPSHSSRRGVWSVAGPPTVVLGLISAAVSTAITPGTCRASVTSRPVIRPRAVWLRTKATCTVPGLFRSSTYCPCPVIIR